MNYPALYFLRHGQTEWNLEGRLQGHLDSPLSDLGQAQALQQREILAPILTANPEITIHASPLGRAYSTALVVANGHSITQVDEIKEVSAGSWEGMLRTDIVAQFAGGSAAEENMFDLFLSAPDGEGAELLRARCFAYLQSLQSPTVIVSHGVVSAYMRGIVLGLSKAEIAMLPHEQGVVTAIVGGQSTTLRSAKITQEFLAQGMDN